MPTPSKNPAGKNHYLLECREDGETSFVPIDGQSPEKAIRSATKKYEKITVTHVHRLLDATFDHLIHTLHSADRSKCEEIWTMAMKFFVNGQDQKKREQQREISSLSLEEYLRQTGGQLSIDGTHTHRATGSQDTSMKYFMIESDLEGGALMLQAATHAENAIGRLAERYGTLTVYAVHRVRHLTALSLCDLLETGDTEMDTLLMGVACDYFGEGLVQQERVMENKKTDAMLDLNAQLGRAGDTRRWRSFM